MGIWGAIQNTYNNCASYISAKCQGGWNKVKEFFQPAGEVFNSANAANFKAGALGFFAFLCFFIASSGIGGVAFGIIEIYSAVSSGSSLWIGCLVLIGCAAGAGIFGKIGYEVMKKKKEFALDETKIKVDYQDAQQEIAKNRAHNLEKETTITTNELLQPENLITDIEGMGVPLPADHLKHSQAEEVVEQESKTKIIQDQVEQTADKDVPPKENVEHDAGSKTHQTTKWSELMDKPVRGRSSSV